MPSIWLCLIQSDASNHWYSCGQDVQQSMMTEILLIPALVEVLWFDYQKYYLQHQWTDLVRNLSGESLSHKIYHSSYSYINEAGDNALHLPTAQPVTKQRCSKSFNQAMIMEAMVITLLSENIIMDEMVSTIYLILHMQCIQSTTNYIYIFCIMTICPHIFTYWQVTGRKNKVFNHLHGIGIATISWSLKWKQQWANIHVSFSFPEL